MLLPVGLKFKGKNKKHINYIYRFRHNGPMAKETKNIYKTMGSFFMSDVFLLIDPWETFRINTVQNSEVMKFLLPLDINM